MRKKPNVFYIALVLSLFVLPSTSLLAGDGDEDSNRDNLSQHHKGTSSQTGQSATSGNLNQGTNSNPSGSQPSGSGSGSMGGQEGSGGSSSGTQDSGSSGGGSGH